MFLQVYLNGHLAARLIDDKRDSVHGSVSLSSRNRSFAADSQ
jgi:hypothetical protein